MRYIIAIVILLALVGLGALAAILSPKRKQRSGSEIAKPKTLGGDKDQLAAVFTSIEEGIIQIDAKGIIILFNQAAALMTGWSIEDTIGLDVQVVIKLADKKGNLYNGASYPFNTVLSIGQSVRNDSTDLITRDDNKISVGLSITPLKSPSGNITGAVALMRNMTEEKERESRLADFISTASHEMRTPVAAIEGYLALALNNKVASVDAKAREYLEKAQLATRHLGELFQDLLTSAKAEDGRLTSHPQVVEMSDLLRGLTEDLKFMAEKHKLKTEFVVGSMSLVKSSSPRSGERQIAPLYYTYIDPDRIREVVTNLYDNAVKYTPEGKITIGLSGDNEVVQFYVQDTGSGIPREDLPHMFQKFYRVDNSATRTVGGTGLGLYICRKIVELYNGRIWVDSEVSKGSTFYINLPRLSTQRATELMKNRADEVTITPTTTNTMALS